GHCCTALAWGAGRCGLRPTACFSGGTPVRRPRAAGRPPGRGAPARAARPHRSCRCRARWPPGCAGSAPGVVVPDKAGLGHRRRVGKSRAGAGPAPRQAAVARPGAVGRQRVAAGATRVERRAARRITPCSASASLRRMLRTGRNTSRLWRRMMALEGARLAAAGAGRELRAVAWRKGIAGGVVQDGHWVRAAGAAFPPRPTSTTSAGSKRAFSITPSRL
ncbi:MAG: hypothetical protein JWP65_1839, partial [Ramlibacter sp.]|nr:hypothetical protein [Ramlibacter sp.]